MENWADDGQIVVFKFIFQAKSFLLFFQLLLVIFDKIEYIVQTSKIIILFVQHKQLF